MNRRRFCCKAGFLAALIPFCGFTKQNPKHRNMYALISKLIAQPGQRDALIAVLLDGSRDLPGCRQYTIAADANETDSLWIFEVWEDQASHKSSLELPRVRAAIASGKPLIAAFAARHEVRPVAVME